METVRKMVYVVFFVVALFEVSRSQTLWEYCGNEPADVVFLLDSSNSIWGPDFRRQLHFVKDLVSMFQIGENATRVGLVTYNDQVDLQFNLKRYFDRDQLLQAIENTRETHGYTTATDLALKYTRTYLFRPSGGGRRGVSKVIVVITDGRSRNVLRTLIEASRNKRNHAHLFAIGVGHAVNYRELTRMASKPTEEYFFQVAGYSALDSLKKILAIKTCQVTHPTTTPTTTTTTTTTTSTTTTTTTTTPPTTTTTTPTTTTTTPTTTTTETTTTPTTTTTTTPPPTTTTTTPTTTTTTIPTTTTTPEPTTTTWVDIVRKACNGKMVDIVFALDNSDAVTHDDFWQMIRFVRDFALGLDIRDNGTRIGIVLFSEMVEQGIELDEHDNIHGLVSHLYKMQMSKGQARVDDMLRYVRTKSFRRSVSRKGAAQVVIMLTASSSLKIHRTKKQAARARKAGLTFITIGVGKRVREEELRVIAGVGSLGDSDKDSSRVKILPPGPPLSNLDEETQMMMQDLMMGDDPLSPFSLTRKEMTGNIQSQDLNTNRDKIDDNVNIDVLDAAVTSDPTEAESKNVLSGQKGKATASVIGGGEFNHTIGGENVTNEQAEGEEENIWDKLIGEKSENPQVPVEGDSSMIEDNDMMKELMRETTTREAAATAAAVSEEGGLEPLTPTMMPTSTAASGLSGPVFKLDEFTQLETILMDTVLQTCAAEPTDNPVADQPCGTRQEADLMFVVDSANAGKKNTRKAMDLIRSVAGDMDIDRDKIQLGLVSPDPCAPQEHHQSFNLSQHHNKDNLINSLNTDTSDFSSLVRDLRRTAFKYRNGARKSAKRVAILIVDGKLDNPLGTLTEAQRIRERKGVEIYVISVGTESPQPEMMMMCDYPTQKHFYHVDNYDRLEDMRETLVDVLCDEL